MGRSKISELGVKVANLQNIENQWSQKIMPAAIDRWFFPIKDLPQFKEFLLKNEWIQRMIGIKFCGSKNGQFLMSEIFDGSGDRIKVAVLFDAKDFSKYYDTFGQFHLILSLYRLPKNTTLYGTKVWSFYVGSNLSRIYRLCIMDDMGLDKK